MYAFVYIIVSGQRFVNCAYIQTKKRGRFQHCFLLSKNPPPYQGGVRGGLDKTDNCYFISLKIFRCALLPRNSRQINPQALPGTEKTICDSPRLYLLFYYYGKSLYFYPKSLLFSLATLFIVRNILLLYCCE